LIEVCRKDYIEERKWLRWLLGLVPDFGLNLKNKLSKKALNYIVNLQQANILLKISSI